MPKLMEDADEFRDQACRLSQAWSGQGRRLHLQSTCRLHCRVRPWQGAGRGDRTGKAQYPRLSRHRVRRSEEHTSELQSLMRISYAVFCLNQKQLQLQTITKN